MKKIKKKKSNLQILKNTRFRWYIIGVNSFGNYLYKSSDNNCRYASYYSYYHRINKEK